ncbi:hypothetical protein GQX74_015200 [Glossina fuscipes]|nr:hypothetical protein GQX74_015200 [Glossina fuscipes]
MCMFRVEFSVLISTAWRILRIIELIVENHFDAFHQNMFYMRLRRRCSNSIINNLYVYIHMSIYIYCDITIAEAYSLCTIAINVFIATGYIVDRVNSEPARCAV